MMDKYEAYEAYKKIINHYLTKIPSDQRNYDNEYSKPIYVVNMFKALLSVLHENGSECTLRQISDLDTYCAGHSDYVHKFALRLAEWTGKFEIKK